MTRCKACLSVVKVNAKPLREMVEREMTRGEFEHITKTMSIQHPTCAAG